MIQSENYQPNVSGFIVKADGNAEFNDGIFRGTLDVNRGIFRGELDVGSLSILNSTPIGIILNYPIGTTAQTIYDAVRQSGIFDVTGTYGGANASRIELIYKYNITNNYPYVDVTYTTEIYITTNTRQLIARTIRVGRTNVTNNAYSESTTNPITTSAALNVQLSTPSKILKLINLPTTQPTEPNVVWRNGNNLMIS